MSANRRLKPRRPFWSNNSTDIISPRDLLNRLVRNGVDSSDGRGRPQRSVLRLHRTRESLLGRPKVGIPPRTLELLSSPWLREF